MPNELITAIGAAIGGIIVVVVPAYIAIKKARADSAAKQLELDKARAELEKKVRNGVIEEWREVADMHGRQLVQSEQRCNIRIDAMAKEILELRTQITVLYTENAQLRQLAISKDKQAAAAQQAVDVVKDKLVETSAEAGRLAGKEEARAEARAKEEPKG